MLQKLLTTLLLILGLTVVSGCIDEQPKEAELESIIKSTLLSNGGDQLFAIENFKIIKSYERGVAHVIDAEYDLVFNRSLREITADLKRASPLAAYEPFGGTSLSLLTLQNKGVKAFKAGDIIRMNGSYSFAQENSDWILKHSAH